MCLIGQTEAIEWGIWNAECGMRKERAWGKDQKTDDGGRMTDDRR
jgi:hypothetical protein